MCKAEAESIGQIQINSIQQCSERPFDTAKDNEIACEASVLSSINRAVMACKSKQQNEPKNVP